MEPVEAGRHTIPRSDTNCPNWTATTKNTYSIKIPANPRWSAASRQIPSGYVGIATGNSTNCPNWTSTSQNTKTIQR